MRQQQRRQGQHRGCRGRCRRTPRAPTSTSAAVGPRRRRPVGGRRERTTSRSSTCCEPRQHHGIGRDAAPAGPRRGSGRGGSWPAGRRRSLRRTGPAPAGRGRSARRRSRGRGGSRPARPPPVPVDRPGRRGRSGAPAPEQGQPAVVQLPLRERQAAEVAEEHDAPARGRRAPRRVPRTGPGGPPRWPGPRRSARPRSACGQPGRSRRRVGQGGGRTHGRHPAGPGRPAGSPGLYGGCPPGELRPTRPRRLTGLGRGARWDVLRPI